MIRYSRTECLRMMKRLAKGGDIEPRLKVSPLTSKTDAELLDMLGKATGAGDKRKSERIAREIARRLEIDRCLHS